MRQPGKFIGSAVVMVSLAGGVGKAQPPSVLLPPDHGVYLGFWAEPGLGGPNKSQEKAIEAREASISRTFALHLHYADWAELWTQLVDSSGAFQPNADLAGDISHGRVPVISWHCDNSLPDYLPSSDALIRNGDPQEDTVILKTASALALYPGPVILRWFWEFNVLSNPDHQKCRGDHGGKPTQQVYDDFVGAWQHIRQLFRQVHADNVVFLWCPVKYRADGEDNPHGFYPGNGFVDWIGVDTYQDSTESFTADFDLFYNDFTDHRYGNKPLMVGENGALPLCCPSTAPNCTSATNCTVTEQQHSYLLGLLGAVQANRYPQLKAYNYFEQGMDLHNWVLDDDGGMAAMETLAASAAFSPIPIVRK